MAGGTGQKFKDFALAAIIIAGVASLLATIASVVSIWLQTKNYRKPLLQRYVVRILLMVPIYSIASFASMVSTTAAAFLDPIRDIYEAFTIYTFFQLLINYLGGERALIIMTHGREPVNHLWPLNHVLARVDISDPYTFLAIKRGILQYAWLKPVLGLSAIIMKATGVYQEGYIGLSSGYFWSGLVYNVSVTVSLYSLGLFWVCMNQDLKPFRPVPKFLCIKLIIFASYWQGFFLSILVWLGAIPDNVSGYTPDNLAAAIQDFLICCEMPAFAIAHWYAFSWHDFADNSISSGRMPVWFAFRDAFGVLDLIEDSKLTFKGDQYVYRYFDSGDKIMAHEASKSRLARLKAGMRYERGGQGKYWIPKPDEINAETPLLGAPGGSNRRSESQSPHHLGPEELVLDPDEEILYDKARKLEHGDWNYPVLTAHEPLRAHWQHSPSESSYQTPAASSADLNASALDRRRRRVKDGPAVKDLKAKKKQTVEEQEHHHAHAGKDPLEIAYGPIVGTAPEIREDDFQVEEDIRTQVGPQGPEHSTERDVSPQGRDSQWEESRRWENSNHNIDTPFHRPPEDQEDHANVWGNDHEYDED